MTSPGKLYLIPTVLAEKTEDKVIPPQTIKILSSIRYFLAENIRFARRYFSSLHIFDSIESLHFQVLDKDTPDLLLKDLLLPLLDGNDMGIISESGCPGIADPGAKAIHFAHQKSIVVVPLVGPSSIVLALMASGLNGQQFAFHGYLPVDYQEASRAIRELEKESKKKNQTQIVIETPFRNNALTKALIENLSPATELCVAMALTSPGELVITLPVSQWKNRHDRWPKEPAIFLFLA
jgi:16S rRNA (cytidine1402-2'-O)-methyltransferase